MKKGRAGHHCHRSSPVVYVVDDDVQILTSVERLLGTVGLSCRPFTGGREFLTNVDLNRPGCVVLDVRLPGIGGSEVQRLLAERGSTLPVIFLTGHADVQLAVRVMKAGALEVIVKPFEGQALVDAVQQGIALDCRRRADQDIIRSIQERVDRLTDRERQVMALVVAGWPNRRIAVELGTSEKTVKAHRGHVMAKMKVRSIVELVRFADRLTTSTAPLSDALGEVPRPGPLEPRRSTRSAE